MDKCITYICQCEYYDMINLCKKHSNFNTDECLKVAGISGNMHVITELIKCEATNIIGCFVHFVASKNITCIYWLFSCIKQNSCVDINHAFAIHLNYINTYVLSGKCLD